MDQVCDADRDNHRFLTEDADRHFRQCDNRVRCLRYYNRHKAVNSFFEKWTSSRQFLTDDERPSSGTIPFIWFDNVFKTTDWEDKTRVLQDDPTRSQIRSTRDPWMSCSANERLSWVYMERPWNCWEDEVHMCWDTPVLWRWWRAEVSVRYESVVDAAVWKSRI